MKKQNILLSALLASQLILAGCGSDDDTTTDDAGVTSTTITGAAVDGYLRNAFICVDSDSNGECDDGEAYSKSSSDGSYSLTFTSTQASGASLLVVGGVDNGTGLAFSGLLKAPLDSTKSVINVTPLTTMVSAQIAQAGGDTSDATLIAAAEVKVAATLGLTTDELISDPVANTNTEVLKKALQIQKTLEILAAVEIKTGASNADALATVSEALAKQFDGTAEANVSTLVTDMVADTSLTLSTALTDVADLAVAVADNLEAVDASATDIQMVAELLVDEAETIVDAVISVTGDVNSSVLLTAVTDAATVIDDNTIFLGNVDRILSLSGYLDTITDANKTALITDVNGTFALESNTTLTDFRTYVDGSGLDCEVPLLQSIDEALTIESALGDTISATTLEDTAFGAVDLETWTGSAVYSSFTATFDSTTKTLNEVEYEYNGTAWVTPSDDSSSEITWDAATQTWITVSYTTGQTYTIDSDGVASITRNGVEAFAVSLQAANDIGDTSKTVTIKNWSDSALSDSVLTPFSTGAVEYVVTLQQPDRISIWAESNGTVYPFSADGTTNYSSFTTALADYSTAGAYLFYENNLALKLETAYTSGATIGTLSQYDYSTGSPILQASNYATWRIETLGGMEVVTFTRNSDSHIMMAAVIYDGLVTSAGAERASEETMLMYNPQAIADIIAAKGFAAQ